MARLRIWISLLGLVFLCNQLIAQDETVLFSHHGGFYAESFYLSMGCSNFNHHIRYTINGNSPTANSTCYAAPLRLDENLYSTSDIFTLPIAPYAEPFVPEAVGHAIVIRAAVFDENGQRVSEVHTQTYLIRSLDCDHHSLPVVSVCCDSLSLFDYDTGILVPGVNYDPDNPEYSGNYYQHGREWERLANVEFYELNNSGINQQCGLRTHGNRARKAAAKGLKIYAREEYGKKHFKHRFFDTTPIQSFKHLVLKPFSTLWPCVGVQDYVANRMALQMGLEAPNSRPVVLYLNGEYWGIYFLQEKMDDRYLEDHFGIAPEQCNIVSGGGIDGYTKEWKVEVESGDGTGFGQMMDWLEEADLSDVDNYAYISNLVDVDNFIDYQILETFIANTDWPANNSRFWQADGSKWRVAFFDGDATLLDKGFDVLENATYVGTDRWNTGDNSTLLFRRLLENNDFKSRYRHRVDELCSGVLQYDAVAPFLDGVEQDLRWEVPNEIARFGYPESLNYWDWGLYLIRDFLSGRVLAYQQACAEFEPLKEHDYQPNTNDFVVYPNPVEDVVCIKMLDGRSRAVDYNLLDMSGRSYMNGMMYIPACATLKLRLDLAAGVYVLKIGGEAHRILKL